MVKGDSSDWVNALGKGVLTLNVSTCTEGLSTGARVIYVGLKNATPRVSGGGGANRAMYR